VSRRAPLAAGLALALAACIPEEGPMMAPGQDCMECHSSGGGGEESARPWSVAGTIAGRQGARVTITDGNGKSFTLRSNQAGNFYSAEGLVFPLAGISVDGAAMPQVPAQVRGPYASCNASRCHPGGLGGSGGGGD
jgi:hypothetical protein